MNNERVHLFLELWSGKLIQQQHGHFQATVSIGKQLKRKYGPDVKWLCVYTKSKILYEYIDKPYEELLDILSFRCPTKPADAQYYKNLLSYLSEKNPLLFNKYLDWIQESKKQNQIF